MDFKVEPCLYYYKILYMKHLKNTFNILPDIFIYLYITYIYKHDGSMKMYGIVGILTSMETFYCAKGSL